MLERIEQFLMFIFETFAGRAVLFLIIVASLWAYKLTLAS